MCIYILKVEPVTLDKGLLKSTYEYILKPRTKGAESSLGVGAFF